MCFDLLLLNDPAEDGSCTIGSITDYALWLDPETVLDPVNHGLGGLRLLRPIGCARFDIHDDPVISVGQVVG